MPRVVIHGSAHLNAPHVEDFKAYLKKLTALSLAEEGCDAYIMTQDQTDPTRFRFFEVFRSPEALATHFATTVASLGRFEAGRADVLASPAVLEKHVLVDDAAPPFVPPKSRL